MPSFDRLWPASSPGSVDVTPAAQPSNPHEQAPIITMRIWQVPTSHIPMALANMGWGRVALRRAHGVTFAKLLGTGSGQTFTVTDADAHHWALLSVSQTTRGAAALGRSRLIRSWNDMASETLQVELRTLSSRGRWSGHEPFPSGRPHRWDGPIAAITRARIKPASWRTFWSAVPPVAADLRGRAGVLLTLGIGEAPIGWQGTFSIWEHNRALTEFAQRGAAHRQAITETARQDWYAEELFARFAVLKCIGTFAGAAVLPAEAS